MNLHSRLAVATALLLALTSISRAADLEPVAVTAEGQAIDWKDCTYTRAGGEVYVSTRASLSDTDTPAGLWRLVAGKAVRVKTADGADFTPAGQLPGGGDDKMRPADNRLIVPGPHNIKEGRESMFGSAWMVRQGVARPLLQSDGSPVIYQRLNNSSMGEDNPMFCSMGDRAPQWWLVKDDQAVRQEIPPEANSGVCVVVDGRPLLRAGLSGTRMWILEKDTWKRVTDRAGAPLEVSTGTVMSSPGGAVSAVGSVLGVWDPAPGKSQILLFSVKGSTAEPIRMPEGVTAHGLMRLGKSAAVMARENNQSVLLSVDGGKVGALKGAPKGNASIISPGEVGVASVSDPKGKTRYYRMDDKGGREIKLPKGFENASFSAMVGEAGKTLFFQSIITEGNQVRRHYWRMDEKCALTPIKMEVGDTQGNDIPYWLIAQDGAYVYLPKGEAGPRFVPAS